jgi:hypothetical protein
VVIQPESSTAFSADNSSSPKDGCEKGRKAIKKSLQMSNAQQGQYDAKLNGTLNRYGEKGVRKALMQAC